ncbi:hypothetical protein NDU88_002462 [Pleurodeles waltl]|uniref:Uncharacterized protein n=1 Tax=Pleurodeles waltl TaxID=8319 RepID=A0AAV7UZU8_PLEWA|nr:hypothetical protein NDU88_002462 [Pleurodeles waltl]
MSLFMSAHSPGATNTKSNHIRLLCNHVLLLAGGPPWAYLPVSKVSACLPTSFEVPNGSSSAHFKAITFGGLTFCAMAGYEGELGKGTFYDDSVGSFEHDLVSALDDGVRHTVNVALAQAIQLIKHHLLDYAEQQGWDPQSSNQEEMQFSQDPTGSSSVANPHQADFEQLV